MLFIQNKWISDCQNEIFVPQNFFCLDIIKTHDLFIIFYVSMFEAVSISDEWEEEE